MDPLFQSIITTTTEGLLTTLHQPKFKHNKNPPLLFNSNCVILIKKHE